MILFLITCESGWILLSFHFSDPSLGLLEIEMNGKQKMSTTEINRDSLDYLHSRKTCSSAISLCVTIFQVTETRNLDIFDVSLFLTFCIQSVTLVRSTSKMFLKFIFLHLHWYHQYLSHPSSLTWITNERILTWSFIFTCPSPWQAAIHAFAQVIWKKKNRNLIILLPSLAWNPFFKKKISFMNLRGGGVGREQELGGEKRETEREREPDMDLDLRTPTSWAELNADANWLNHPGTST